MDKNKIRKINELIESLKVIDYKEQDVSSDTTFLKLKVGHYSLNNGETIRRESVVKENGSADATAIFAITKQKEILLVIQPRTPLPTNTKIDIELPAGYIEPNETPEIAAMRELEEETGYKAEDIKIIDEYYPSLGYSGEKIYIALAIGCEKVTNQHLDKDEFVHYIHVNIEEFKYLIDNKYILDATARLGYYKVLEYFKTNNMLDMVGR